MRINILDLSILLRMFLTFHHSISQLLSVSCELYLTLKKFSTFASFLRVFKKSIYVQNSLSNFSVFMEITLWFLIFSFNLLIHWIIVIDSPMLN